MEAVESVLGWVLLAILAAFAATAILGVVWLIGYIWVNTFYELRRWHRGY